MANNPHIICGRDPGKRLSGLGEPLKRVLKRAGMENVRVHDLRRTVGSWLAQAGRSLHLIGDVLNHKDPKTTAGYAYFQTQQRREALTGHGERVLALGGPHMRAGEPPVISTGGTRGIAGAIEDSRKARSSTSGWRATNRSASDVTGSITEFTDDHPGEY